MVVVNGVFILVNKIIGVSAVYFWTVETSEVGIMLQVFASDRNKAINKARKECLKYGKQFVEVWLGYKWQNDLGKDVK
jgi:hypothetical protein